MAVSTDSYRLLVKGTTKGWGSEKQQVRAERLMQEYEAANGLYEDVPVEERASARATALRNERIGKVVDIVKGLPSHRNKAAMNLVASTVGLPGDIVSMLEGKENDLTSESIANKIGGDSEHFSFLPSQLVAPGPGELKALSAMAGGLGVVRKGGKALQSTSDVLRRDTGAIDKLVRGDKDGVDAAERLLRVEYGGLYVNQVKNVVGKDLPNEEVFDIVEQIIPKTLEELKKGKWDPSRGSLGTYLNQHVTSRAINEVDKYWRKVFPGVSDARRAELVADYKATNAARRDLQGNDIMGGNSESAGLDDGTSLTLPENRTETTGIFFDESGDRLTRDDAFRYETTRPVEEVEERFIMRDSVMAELEQIDDANTVGAFRQLLNDSGRGALTRAANDFRIPRQTLKDRWERFVERVRSRVDAGYLRTPKDSPEYVQALQEGQARMLGGAITDAARLPGPARPSSSFRGNFVGDEFGPVSRSGAEQASIRVTLDQQIVSDADWRQMLKDLRAINKQLRAGNLSEKAKAALRQRGESLKAEIDKQRRLWRLRYQGQKKKIKERSQRPET